MVGVAGVLLASAWGALVAAPAVSRSWASTASPSAYEYGYEYGYGYGYDEVFAPTVERFAGSDRYGTATTISALTFDAPVRRAYIASGQTFSDALSAGPAAAHAGGPVLLSAADHLPSSAAAELRRLHPAEVILVGGEEALSSAVQDDAAAASGVTVRRIAGTDRYETMAAISADAFPAGPSVVYLTSGGSFGDTLAAGAAAAGRRAPLLLTAPGSLPSATARELRRLAPGSVVIVGGTGAVSSAVEAQVQGLGLPVRRISGSDRYRTAVGVAEELPSSRSFIVASGDGFADGLAGIPLAGATGAPLLLVDRSDVAPSVTDLLRSRGASSVLLLGGTSAISDAIEAHLAGR
jgi:putative cell wall-binding protein